MNPLYTTVQLASLTHRKKSTKWMELPEDKCAKVAKKVKKRPLSKKMRDKNVFLCDNNFLETTPVCCFFSSGFCRSHFIYSWVRNLAYSYVIFVAITCLRWDICWQEKNSKVYEINRLSFIWHHLGLNWLIWKLELFSHQTTFSSTNFDP